MARLRPQLTAVFMGTELRGDFTVLTELALNFLVRIRLVVVLLSLRHHLTTEFALKVHAGASDVMHPELADVDHALARAALFLLFLLFHHLN